MLTIENLLLSSDIHRLYLIETPQIILLQFLKQWMSSVKTQFSEGKKRAFFSRKNPVFLPSNHNWSVFCFAKTASPPDFFPVRIVVSPSFYACPPQRVINTTDSTCKEASINMNAWRKFPLV